MVAIPPTASNRNLATAVNKRINADSVMVAAKASLWRLGGTGLLLMFTGIGVACALYGYSYISDNRGLGEHIANSLAKALEHTQIPISGSVEMVPGLVTMEPGKVEMKPGVVEMKPGTVEMKQPGVVEMKPGTVSGSVTVIGPFANDTARSSTTMPAPSTPTPSTPTPTPAPSVPYARPWDNPTWGNPNTPPNATVVRNFTLFNSVRSGSGQVVTGWKFSSSELTAPEHQYCYYRQDATGDITNDVHLAVDGQLTSAAQQGDGPTQLALCIWFGGQRPPPQSVRPQQPVDPVVPPLPQEAGPDLEPSFDCSKPKLQPLAKLICSYKQLAKVDLEFNQAYWALRHQSGRGPARNQLLKEDLDFLKIVQGICVGISDAQSANCVKIAYGNKRAEWLTRITKTGGPAQQEASRPIEQHIALQRKLQELGIYAPEAKVDGVYGEAMRDAITIWQTVNNRPKTGFISDDDAVEIMAAKPPAVHKI